jgi:hypothetical protein
MNFDETEFKQMLINRKMQQGKTMIQAVEELRQDTQLGWLFQSAKGKEKKAKYNNKHVSVDGMSFDSKKESEFYIQQKLRLRARDIKIFARQVPFILNEADNGNTPVILVLDFIVWENDGRIRYIDIKPAEDFKTDVYKVKKRLFESQSGLMIEEIYTV